MAKADIEINAVAASDTDVPINVLVQLSNNDDGDETTYLWEIIEQPPGAADALSSTVIENPTITPQKEHTYLIQLTVDATLSTESVDRKLFRVRHLKTDAANPGAQESIEADATDGWAAENNLDHNLYQDRIFDGSIVAAVAVGALTAGTIVKFTDYLTIKTGLPGEEPLPQVSAALATSADVLDNPLGLVISKPDGSTTIGASDIVLVRMLGLVRDFLYTGTPTIGDPVYVSDTGTVVLTPGTNTRQIGTAIETSGGDFRLFFNGVDTFNSDAVVKNPAGPTRQDINGGVALGSVALPNGAGTKTMDGDDGGYFSVDLQGGAVTFAAPINVAVGQVLNLRAIDTTGGGSYTFNAVFLFAGGTAPAGGTLNQIDLISCVVTAVDGSNIATEVLTPFTEAMA